MALANAVPHFTSVSDAHICSSGRKPRCKKSNLCYIRSIHSGHYHYRSLPRCRCVHWMWSLGNASTWSTAYRRRNMGEYGWIWVNAEATSQRHCLWHNMRWIFLNLEVAGFRWQSLQLPGFDVGCPSAWGWALLVTDGDCWWSLLWFQLTPFV